MATFYWNSEKNEDIITQWIDHLQHEAYVKDINQIIEKNGREINESIRTGSANQLKAIKRVCGQLDDMNHNINNKLGNINNNISSLRGEINSMAAMLDWKLSQILEEQRITNQLLGFIAQLLRIPDSQKQRVYHIEQGIKYLKNAFMENDVNSSFYIDAFEDLKKAEEIERKDFITLNRIGQIHLYSKKHLDVEKAEEYFLKSARESQAEANVNGTNVSNNLSPNGYDTDVYSDNPFLAATAESYLFAGRACYLQKKLDNAIEYTQKAIDIVPEFLQAGFEQAKYLAAANKIEQARNSLKKVILKDRYFSVKTVKDLDLISKKEIVLLLDEFYLLTKEKAFERIENLENNIIKQSNATATIAEMKKHLSKNNFLSNMAVFDMLKANYNFHYITYRESGYNIIKNSVNPSLSLDKFIEKEKNSESELSNIRRALENKKKKEIDKKFKSTVTAWALGIGGIVGVVIIIAFFGCLLSNSFLECLPMLLVYVGGAVIIGAILGAIFSVFTRPNIKIRIK